MNIGHSLIGPILVEIPLAKLLEQILAIALSDGAVETLKFNYK